MKHTVLIVDDEPLILRAITRILRTDELIVITCESHKEAEKILESNNISLVITDIMLDSQEILDSNNGIALMEQVKEKYNIPVIVISGNHAALVTAKHHGADEIIEKPYDPDQLNMLVNHYVKKCAN